MKSYVRTIIMLGVIALLTVSSIGAKEIPGETAIAGSLQPAAAPPPSKETVPPPLPPSPPGDASFSSVAGEADFATGVELKVNPNIVENAEVMSVAVEPSRGTYSYVSVAPATASRSSSSSRKVLVIPNTEIKTEDLAAITQDLQVMAHIFHKIFTGPRLTEGLFVDYGDFFGRGSRATEAVYLQGYGVLFLMEVNIPLSSPPKAKETEKDENTQKADSVWNRAKQEIFHSAPTRNTRAFDSTEIYDAEKVEELKSRLIKALKQAANVRNLKSDELIILTVIGKGRRSNERISYGAYGGSEMSSQDPLGTGGGAENVGRSYSRTRGRYSASATRIVPGGTGISAPTVLTIRAKKSDVDAFAKGDLDYDKFREKVQILSYPSLGQQVGRAYRIIRQPIESTTETEPAKDAQF